MSLERLQVVLHQTQGSENVGSVARLLANFGFTRLVLSEPQALDWEIARRRAVGAEPILAAREEHTGLKAALRGADYALGTSFRLQVGAKSALTPEEGIARLMRRAAKGSVALVLGGERRGLSDDEIALCDDFVRIDANGPQPSLNLAQAAAVLLYLCARERRAVPPADVPPPARRETRDALETAMRAALERAGFLNPQAPDYVLREMLEVLRRAEPTQREVELWTAMFKQLSRGV